MSNDRKDRVFLSYASEDLVRVRQVYEGLVNRGLDVWFDKKHLEPGKWKHQITRAITKSRYFIICLSNAAIRKTGDEPGFQDEELNDAYEIAKSQPESEFAIIPVRLEDCHRGDHRLTLFQQYDLYDDFEKGIDKLVVDIGGTSLSNPETNDERSDEEKLVDRLCDKATAEYYAGNYKSSINILESVLSISPDKIIAWDTKGLAHIFLGQKEEAINAFDRALELNPDDITAWISKGLTLGSLNRNKEALDAFEKGLELYPDFASAWNNKGKVLSKLSRYAEALDAYDIALKLDPVDDDAWVGKGTALIFLRRTEEALTACETASNLNPRNSEAWIEKGGALCILGRHQDALTALDKGFEINPDDVKGLFFKHIVFYNLGRHEEADAAIEKIMKLLNIVEMRDLTLRDKIGKILKGKFSLSKNYFSHD